MSLPCVKPSRDPWDPLDAAQGPGSMSHRAWLQHAPAAATSLAFFSSSLLQSRVHPNTGPLPMLFLHPPHLLVDADLYCLIIRKLFMSVKLRRPQRTAIIAYFFSASPTGYRMYRPGLVEMVTHSATRSCLSRPVSQLCPHHQGKETATYTLR